MMTINEVSFNRPEVVAGFSVVFGFCWLRPFRASFEVLRKDHDSPQVHSRISGPLPSNFAVPSAIRNMKCSPFLDIIVSFALSLRAWISDAFNFPSSSISATMWLPSRFFPATNAYPRNLPCKTFLPNWWGQRSEFIQPFAPQGMIGPLNGSPNRFSQSVLPSAKRCRTFADSNSIPLNQPTIFHTSQIATILQTFLPYFSALLSRQSHSSQIDEVWKYNDSTISSQDLPNSNELSVYMTFRFSDGWRNVRKLFSVS